MKGDKKEKMCMVQILRQYVKQTCHHTPHCKHLFLSAHVTKDKVCFWQYHFFLVMTAVMTVD